MCVKKKKSKKEVRRYLAIPYNILNLTGIGLCQKVLLSHIYGFGAKGCYQSNETLGRIFMVSASTISRWIADISAHLYYKNPKGYYRTLWAKCHPQVKERSFFAPKEDKKNRLYLSKSAEQPAQKRSGDRSKSANRVMQNCATINNNTNKEISKKITPPPTLPAGGQSSAVLEQRRRQSLEIVEKFKRTFGSCTKKARTLTPEQFEQRRSQAINALRARQSLASLKS